MGRDAVGLKTCSWSKLEQFQVFRLDTQGRCIRKTIADIYDAQQKCYSF